MLYQKQDDGYISNLYNYQLINKTDLESEITFIVKDIEGAIIEVVGEAPRTQIRKISEGAVFIKLPASSLSSRKTNLVIEVIADDKVIDKVKTSFLGPRK